MTTKRAIWICNNFVPLSNAKNACVHCGKRRDLHDTGKNYVTTTSVPANPRE